MVTFPMSNDIPPEQIVPNVLVVEDNIFEPTLDLFGVEMLTLDITYNGTTSSEMQLGSIIISGDTGMLANNYWTCMCCYLDSHLWHLNTYVTLWG